MPHYQIRIKNRRVTRSITQNGAARFCCVCKQALCNAKLFMKKERDCQSLSSDHNERFLNCDLPTGWQDEFVKKSPKIYLAYICIPIFVKINTKLFPWKKLAQTLFVILTIFAQEIIAQ
jgi:hypothetical protein